ncbi:MAG: nanT 1 [Verrucomicrobiales bacterium]|nr:nanT 1 [Verrucomicrobiales bacterium]
MSGNSPDAPAAAPARRTLRDLSPSQWKSGIAAWLGWLFDGLDLHLYTLVATSFVALLLHFEGPLTALQAAERDYKAGLIQASFLVGWALGGTFFGRLGDIIGRSRALSLTILTYAVFTGLAFFATEWWHLMIFRFLAALGIGGEWAVGSTLLAETWPRSWRKWIAAVLQTAVNIGIMLAVLAGFLMKGLPPNWIFLVGVLPALIVFWIRKHVPEPESWHAQRAAKTVVPSMWTLFHGNLKRITIPAIIVCAFSLTGWWAFLFWQSQWLRGAAGAQGLSSSDVNSLVARSFGTIIAVSIPANFVAGWLATRVGYRKAMAIMFTGFIATVLAAFVPDHSLLSMAFFWLPLVGFCSGVYGLFTMFLPPLFPSLLRTTGAGFCYNIGRLAAAAGTIFAQHITGVTGSLRFTLAWASLLWIPAIICVFWLPEPDESEPAAGDGVAKDPEAAGATA